MSNQDYENILHSFEENKTKEENVNFAQTKTLNDEAVKSFKSNFINILN